MELIKKLIDQATTDEEQLVLINDMISKHDLPFIDSYMQDVYKFIRYVINNVDRNNLQLLQDYFSFYDFCYDPERDCTFLDYHYNYDNDKYRAWLTKYVIYLLGSTLENDINMHISIIRSVEKKEFKIQHFERITCGIYNNGNEVNQIRCSYRYDDIVIFQTLLNNGLFDYEKYCEEEWISELLYGHVSEILSGRSTKNANKIATS